ncbi:MAG: cellulase family glycosylhydrolase [Spirochaetota bacterium]
MGHMIFRSVLITTAVCVTLAAGLFAEWRPIELIPDDSQSDKAFERVSPVNYAASTEGWTTGESDQYAVMKVSEGTGRAGKAVKIDFTFIGREKLEYVNVGKEFVVDKPGLYIGMWAKFDGETGSLRLRVNDASGETHQLEYENSIVKGEWKFYACKLKDHGGAWGGDGNRKLDYPVKPYAIVYDRPSKGYKGAGSITIDDIYLMKKREEPRPLFKAEIDSPAYGNSFSAGSVKLKLSPAADGIVGANYSISDGTRVFSKGSMELSKENVITIGPKVQGFITATIESTLAGVPVASYTVRMSVNPAIDLKSIASSFFGICTHYQSGFRPDYFPPETMNMMASAGIKYLRDEMCWSRVEQKKGGIVFDPKYDAYIDAALALGIEPLIILNYGNKFYDEGNFPASDETLAAYGAYCKALAAKYRGRIKCYEVWNEWTGGCGMKGKDGKNRPGNTPENYVKVLKTAFEAVRAVDANAYIVGLGGEHSTHDLKPIEAMFAAGALSYCNAVSVHPYRYPSAPEDKVAGMTLVEEMKNIKSLIEKYNGKQNIWITEVGWPTHKGSRETTETEQARMLVRAHVLMLSTGVVEKLFWYDLMDDGADRAYNENNFGILRNAKFGCMPKPAYSAYVVMSSLLSGAQFVKERNFHADALAFEFKRASGAVIAAWSPKTSATVTVPAGMNAVDIMGNALGTGTVTLTASPVYFVKK